MHPVLIEIGSVTVYTYTVLMDAGLLLGVLLFWWQGRRLGLNTSAILDATLSALAGGIILGRAAHVGINWIYYREHLAEIAAIWRGGISFHGAFVGGALGLAAYVALSPTWRQRPGFWPLADAAVLSLPPGLILGWLACLAEGCAYGLVGEGSLHPFLPDIYGVVAPRFATQVIGAGLSLAAGAILWGLRGREPFSGSLFGLGTILYFGPLFFLEFTRGDETLYWGSWRIAQVVDLVLVIVGLIVFIWCWQRRLEPK